MKQELPELRANAYRSASQYHREAARYFDSLRPHIITQDHRSEVINGYLESGRAYATELGALIAYLIAHEPTSQELDRAQRIKNLLEYEMSLI
jgi:hypothetical protein